MFFVMAVIGYLLGRWSAKPLRPWKGQWLTFDSWVGRVAVAVKWGVGSLTSALQPTAAPYVGSEYTVQPGRRRVNFFVRGSTSRNSPGTVRWERSCSGHPTNCASWLRIPSPPRFDFVGRCGEKQVLAFVTGALPDEGPWQRYIDPDNNDWRTDKPWLAVVHLFDAEGNHHGSEARLGGYDSEGYYVAGDKARAQLARMLHELGAVEPCDIHVKLFSVVIDGIKHSLFYWHFVEDDSEDEAVMLEPRDVMFHPPWESGVNSS